METAAVIRLWQGDGGHAAAAAAVVDRDVMYLLPPLVVCYVFWCASSVELVLVAFQLSIVEYIFKS